MDLLGYFDLNRRAANRLAWPQRTGVGQDRSSLPQVGSVDDDAIPGTVLPPDAATETNETTETDIKAPAESESRDSITRTSMPLWEQLLMYLGILIGVAFSSALLQFASGKTASIGITSTSVVLSALVALVIMPAVFEKLRLGVDVPLLVRFGVFVQHGVFWQVIFGSIGKAMQ